MLTFYAILVLASAISILFIKEFTKVFKAIFSIPGTKLILPLLAASLLVQATDQWLLWILLRIWTLLHHLMNFLSTFLGSRVLMDIIFLMLLGILPIWISLWRSKDPDYHYIKTNKVYFWFMIWIVFAILITFP